jgi:hypothetical protein
MRWIGYALFAIAAAGIVVLSVANRHFVTLYATPDFTGYGAPAPLSYEAPLFVVALACGTLGFLLGALREYLRETRYRKQMSDRGREIGALKREVQSLREERQGDEDDEIIALTTR